MDARLDPPPVAIVGLSAHFGPFAGQASVSGAVSWERRVATGRLARGTGGERPRPLGIAARDGTTARSRVSTSTRSSSESTSSGSRPRNSGEMLPQQSLMLRVAAEAIGDARLGRAARAPNRRPDRHRAGLEHDQFHLRWSLADRAREWNEKLGLGLSREDLARWIDELRRAAGPA